jgi:NADPH:quinone reductase-like Zn-dependent oxidoreductase
VLVPSEAAEPVAGPSQVVVEVSVAPVLFLDTQIRSGSARAWFPATPPYVPGRGVAGGCLSSGRAGGSGAFWSSWLIVLARESSVPPAGGRS